MIFSLFLHRWSVYLFSLSCHSKLFLCGAQKLPFFQIMKVSGVQCCCRKHFFAVNKCLLFTLNSKQMFKLRIFFSVPHKEKFIQLWNNMWMKKWWPKFHFWENYLLHICTDCLIYLFFCLCYTWRLSKMVSNPTRLCYNKQISIFAHNSTKQTLIIVLHS